MRRDPVDLQIKGQALDQQLEVLLNHSPTDFGYLEAAWTVGLIRQHLASCQLEVSDSTVRRHLQGGGWVYKRFARTVPEGAPGGADKKPGWQTRRVRPWDWKGNWFWEIKPILAQAC